MSDIYLCLWIIHVTIKQEMAIQVNLPGAQYKLIFLKKRPNDKWVWLDN